MAEAAIPATAGPEAHRDHAMAPAAKAFHNQRPQAIAATGFPQTAATGHCSHMLSQSLSKYCRPSEPTARMIACNSRPPTHCQRWAKHPSMPSRLVPFGPRRLSLGGFTC